MKTATSLIAELRSRFLAMPVDLRGKLVLGNVAVVVFALLAMGYYVFFRAQQANQILSQQLAQSVQQQAESNVSSLAANRADAIDAVFQALESDITKLGATTESLLASGTGPNFVSAWDPSQFLVQLPDGSWDNDNGETGAVFLPATTDFNTYIGRQIASARQLDLIAPNYLETNPDLLAVYFGGRFGEMVYYPNLDFAAMVPADFDVTQQPWYADAAPTVNPERKPIWSDPYLDPALHGLIVTGSVPVFDALDQFRGATAVDIQLVKIVDQVSGIRAGASGFAFLVDSQGRLIALPEAGQDIFGVSAERMASGEFLEAPILRDAPLSLIDILTKMTTGQSGIRTVEVAGREYFVAYQLLDTVGYSLGLMVPAEEMLTAAVVAEQQVRDLVRESIAQSLLIVLAVLAISVLASTLIGRGLTAPLTELTATAQKVTAGDLQATAIVQTKDEIGILATTLNSMTSSLRDLIQGLEARVAERTADLDAARKHSERRAAELQIIAEMSSLITSESNLDSLLPLTTRLVSERFGFYHAGVFLVDASGRFAVLRAANSTGGQKMLARGHRLEVGVTGIVGQVARSGKPRIALDVGEDPVFFDNPDLPETRSEMALPLNSRGRTIGVLDVQSTQSGAFTDEDAKTLGILADQIGAAIENANLHGQTQEALAEARVLYSQYLQESWKQVSDTEAAPGYVQELVGGKRLEQPVDNADIQAAMESGHVIVKQPESDRAIPLLLVPIKLRGQVIGVVNVQGTLSGRSWTEDEVEIAEASAERLGLALENARLLQDSQRRAAKERAIGEITAKISATISSRQVVETAVEELERALDGSAIAIQIQNESDSDGPGTKRPLPGINVPIALRGETLGTLNVRTPSGMTLKPDQMDMIYAVAERVALSLENAHLFEETTRRAQRERLVTEITTKIRRTNDPQEMIQTAIAELRQALGVSRVEVIPQSSEKGNGS